MQWNHIFRNLSIYEILSLKKTYNFRLFFQMRFLCTTSLSIQSTFFTLLQDKMFYGGWISSLPLKALRGRIPAIEYADDKTTIGSYKNSRSLFFSLLEDESQILIETVFGVGRF